MSSSALRRTVRPGRGRRRRRADALGEAARRAGRTGPHMITWPPLFAVFLVCHLSGDLLLQTEWQAFTKVRGLGDAEGRRALLAHAATYTLVYTPALAWLALDRTLARAAGVAALIAVPHVILDDGRFVRSWLREVKHSPDPAPTLKLTVDQSFHVVCLLGAAMAATA